MPDTTNPIEALFLQALEVPVEKRAEFLQQACSGDEDRRRVEELLAAHEQTGSYRLDRSAAWVAGPGCVSQELGDSIGTYTLREKIGEGGMGVVFVAEQAKPIQRKVALKVIKPGMDSKAVLARFEAEQQALAMMNHKNIAKVLDAGLSEGRPYFVMELVPGIPITEYCDEKKLNINERLELFMQVCQAIQHAHQKGIIHRDIKPSNVLVTEEDGDAVPKVIDFGVAKALSQKLTDRTLYTNFQAFLGTPLYASPEQASLSNVDVDTRSDVYSLGVLLYELVTGSTPYDKESLQKAAYEEMRRIIREQEAVKPSSRLSTLGASATDISNSRRSDPTRLIQSVRGDLDWIVMKALEKDRGRRYEGANNLAQDISRMLNCETIVARPPSVTYRLTQFARRNRTWVRIGLASLVGLCVALGVFSSLFVRNLNLLEQSKELVIEKCLTQACSGQLEEVELTLANYESLLASGRWPVSLRAIALLHAGQNVQAIELLSEVVKDYPNDLVANAVLSIAYTHHGKWPEGVECGLRVETLALQRDMSGAEEFLYGYSRMYIDSSEGASILEKVIEEHPTWLMARVVRAGALGHTAERSHKKEDADAALREARTSYAVLPNNAFVQMMTLFAYNTAICIYKSESRDITELSQSANLVLQELSAKKDYPLGVAMVAQHLDILGETEKSNEYWKLAGSLGAGFWSEFSIATFFATHSTKETLEMLQKLPNRTEWEVRLAEAFVLADVPAMKQDALGVFAESIALSSPPFRWYKSIQILLLTGEFETAQKRARDFLRAPSNQESILNEIAALKVVASNEPPRFDGQAKFQELFMAALWHISRGEREDAIRFLERTEDVAYMDLSRYWARAYRSKLLSDPAWPRANPQMSTTKVMMNE